MYFLMTNDVESFSIPLNKLDVDTAKEVYEVGLPRLLDLYARHDIKCTFYFTGTMCELVPGSIDLVKAHGHEIGCHSYSHAENKALDVLSYEEQLNEIKKAKKLIESIAGEIESFRAPALRLNGDTVKALEATGFSSDSSICSQRFDGPFTFGSKRKLKWLYAPRKPYFLSYDSTIKKGNSKVLEIPVSALLFPFSGTVMRRSALITKILQKYLFFEAKQNDKPVVFLFHPNECLEFKGKAIPTRRSTNFFEHLFSDVIRQKLKLKNLGMESLKLLDEVLRSASEYGFEFVTANEYTRMYKDIYKGQIIKAIKTGDFKTFGTSKNSKI